MYKGNGWQKNSWFCMSLFFFSFLVFFFFFFFFFLLIFNLKIEIMLVMLKFFNSLCHCLYFQQDKCFKMIFFSITSGWKCLCYPVEIFKETVICKTGFLFTFCPIKKRKNAKNDFFFFPWKWYLFEKEKV